MTGEITARLDSSLHLPRAALPAAPLVAALKRLATPLPILCFTKSNGFDFRPTIRHGSSSPESCTRIVSCCRVESSTKPLASSKVPVAPLRFRTPVRMRHEFGGAFHGELRTEQERAVREMVKHDYGVLSAPPGAGKTVIVYAR